MGFLNSATALQTFDNGRGLSHNCWKHCPLDRILADRGVGVYFHEDFHNFGGAVDTNVGTYYGPSGFYTSFEDTSFAVAQDATFREGVLKITSPATDNKEAWLQAGSATGVQAKLLDADSKLDRLWFQCRLRWDNVANTQYGSFSGLGAAGLAVENTLADAGTLVDKDLLGFFRPEGDGDGVDFIYREEGSDLVNVVEDMVIAADTWYNFAFNVDPRNTDSARLTVYQDNVEKGHLDLTTIPADFPAGKLLSFLHGFKTATGTAFNFRIDSYDLAMTYKL